MKKRALKAKQKIQTLLPSDPAERYYLALAVLHTLGALLATSLSMYCDVSVASSQAMLPAVIFAHFRQSNNNVTEVRAFQGAYPWTEDANYGLYRWNPYILVTAFEWLTAVFVTCNIRHWVSAAHLKAGVALLLALGAASCFLWFILPGPSSQPFCLPMAVALAVSFVATWWGIHRYFVLFPLPGDAPKTQPAAPAPPEPSAPEYEPFPEPSSQKDTEPRAEDEEYLVPESRADARTPRRTWNVPRRVASLKTPVAFQSKEEREAAEHEKRVTFEAASHAVALRYFEYCVTAPLLYLAILCLLVPDAPAWLFLGGYWLIQACNAIGIALHYNITLDMLAGVGRTGGVARWVHSLMDTGVWRDHTIQYFWLLCASWLCLMVPIGALVYMTRGWLLAFDENVPWIAYTMVWLLLISYCMFGVIPTGVYLVKSQDALIWLPWVLDGLNLGAKLPVPMLLLIAFATRPAGFPPC